MEPWTFIHATDIHVGSPRSFRYAPAWNANWRTARAQIIAMRPDLLLVGGDLARDGNIHRWELEAVKADLDALPFPCHAIPGNMDTNNKHTQVSGAQPGRDDVALNVTMANYDNYRAVFGQPWWTFLHKGVRFTGLGGMLFGSGLPLEDELWAFLESLPGLPPARHHIWLTHYPLFTQSPDEPNWDITDPAQYREWYFNIDRPGRDRLLEIMRATGATRVLSGHTHVRKQFVAAGIHFDIGASTAFTQGGPHWPDGDHTLGFQRYDVTDEGIAYAFVPLAEVSTAQGYGPGGHPRPEERDYTMAWER